MKREYWENVAGNYEDEIFEVFEHDREGLVLKALKKYGVADGVANDIGCGIGDFLPALSKNFRKVVALDISAKCIARARAKYAALPNVEYQTKDLSASRVHLPKAHLALSCNSVITASMKHRNAMLDLMCRHLLPKGHLVLVVPSLESALLTRFRLIEWNLKDGLSPASAVRAGFPKKKNALSPRIHEGVVNIEGVETKHFLKEELQVLMKNRGMNLLDIQKIEYHWNTEFTSPPHWMKDPCPWDWLCTAQKSKG